MKIKELFDSSRDIHRTIEKVITYNASQAARLKAEIDLRREGGKPPKDLAWPGLAKP